MSPHFRPVLRPSSSNRGKCSILINNVTRPNDERHATDSVTEQVWTARIAVNLCHQFFCAQVLPDMKAVERRHHQSRLDWSDDWSGRHGSATRRQKTVLGLTRSLATRLRRIWHPRQRGMPVDHERRQLDKWVTPKPAQIMARQCLKPVFEPAEIANFASSSWLPELFRHQPALRRRVLGLVRSLTSDCRAVRRICRRFVDTSPAGFSTMPSPSCSTMPRWISCQGVCDSG